MTTDFIEVEELEQLLEQEGLVVVDFTATWCGPCKVIAPRIDQLAEEFADKVKVFKLDIDTDNDKDRYKNNNQPTLAKKYGIRSIPAVLYFKDGELTETIVGVSPYATFSDAVNKYL